MSKLGTIVFKLNQETRLPQSLITDTPTQGAFDNFARYVLENYDVEVSLDDSIKYLVSTGGWTVDELQNLESNKRRLLWISLLDCKDQNTNFWYMGW